MLKIIFSCKDTSELVSASLDRPLGIRQRAAMMMHLAMCSMCRRYRRQAIRLQEWFVKAGKNAGAEQALNEDTARRIQQAIDRSGETTE